MSLHFTDTELAARRERACASMRAAGLDGLLMFRQESMFYLTGYDTFGYCFFQCMYLGADGRLILLTRAPDFRQAQFTSVVEDIRVWVDLPDAGPAEQVRDIAEECGHRGGRLGIEWDAYGLTAANGRKVDAAFQGFCTLEDASDLVSELRIIKSATEIDLVRKAAALTDDAYDAAAALTSPGADEGEILAAMQGAVFKGGGDYPGNEFIIGSGDGALMCRYYSGRRVMDAQDQLTLEWAGAYGHYHAAMMRTFVVGDVPARQQHLFDACHDALLAVEADVVPGKTFGDAFEAHARTIDAAGLAEHRLNACGYSLGTTFAPTWMDWAMMYRGNSRVFEPGMVIFCHMIIFDSDAGLAMTLGETVLVTETGNERLSRSPLDLVVR